MSPAACMLREPRLSLAFWRLRPQANHAGRNLAARLPLQPRSHTSSAVPDRAAQQRATPTEVSFPCGRTRYLFDGTRHRDAVSWNAMVSGHARRGNVPDALGTAARMHSSGQPFTEATFASVVGACARGRMFRAGTQAHGQVIKSGCEGSAVIGASLLDFYSSCFDLRATRALFESLHQRNELLWSPMVVALVRFGLLAEALDLLQITPARRDVFAWTAVISGYAKGTDQCCGKALQLFVKLLADDGAMPNEYTYDCVLRACVRLGALDFGRSVHGCLIRCGFWCEQLITSALVDLYCTSDALDDALLVYNDLDRPPLITSNTLIAGLISIGRTEDAKMVFSQMPEQDSGSYNLMIKAYAMEGKLEHCRRMFEKMPKRNMVSLNSMMSVLLQNGRLEEGLKLFKQIKDERDTVTWNSMISGYIQNDEPSEALKLFVVMCRLYIGCSPSTFSALLHACATIGTLEQGRMIHAHLCKTSFDSNGHVGTALADMYFKCGCVIDARSAFTYVTSPNVASWTCLVNGLAQNGLWLEALLQFGRMLKHHVSPNEITFLGLLMASARAGLVNKGMKIFYSMENFGLVPTVQHYTCAVDLLGRTGHTREAEKFIYEMPLPADGIIWEALLTACWYSVDLEMGEKVAQRLFFMGTKHRSAYVAMSNIYAKLGKWEDVVKVRTQMRSLNEKKEPGCSWIEIKDIVHIFLVDDQNHPERDHVYSMLEGLVSHISLHSEPNDMVIQSLNS